MNSSFAIAVKHGAVVAGHIILSVFLTGLGIALADPSVMGVFSSYVTRFGIPVAIVNIVIAAVIKYVKTQPIIPADVTDQIIPPSVQ